VYDKIPLQNVVGINVALPVFRRFLLVVVGHIVVLRFIGFVPAFALHKVDKASLARSQPPHSTSKRPSCCGIRIVVLLTGWQWWKIEMVAEQPMVLPIFVLELLATAN